MVKFVNKAVISVGISAAVIIGAVWLSKRYDLGSKVQGGVFGFGQNVGKAVTLPFAGLFNGITQGTGAIAEQLGQTQEALFHQGAVTQDQFNNFFHPDWFNPDGSFTSKHPDYGKRTSTLQTNQSTFKQNQQTIDKLSYPSVSDYLSQQQQQGAIFRPDTTNQNPSLIDRSGSGQPNQRNTSRELQTRTISVYAKPNVEAYIRNGKTVYLSPTTASALQRRGVTITRDTTRTTNTSTRSINAQAQKQVRFN